MCVTHRWFRGYPVTTLLRTFSACQSSPEATPDGWTDLVSPKVSSCESSQIRNKSDFVAACVARRVECQSQTADGGIGCFFRENIFESRDLFVAFLSLFSPLKRRTRRRITDARDRGDRSNRAQEVIQIPALIAPPP